MGYIGTKALHINPIARLVVKWRSMKNHVTIEIVVIESKLSRGN